MRAAGFGAGAGQALAAKGLDADDGTNLVAVDINIADPGALGDALHGSVDARVNAQGQAKAGGVDGVNHGIQFRGFSSG